MAKRAKSREPYCKQHHVYGCNFMHDTVQPAINTVVGVSVLGAVLGATSKIV